MAIEKKVEKLEYLASKESCCPIVLFPPHSMIPDKKRRLSVNLSPASHGENDKYARLISAAPELLDSLRILYEETADYILLNHLGDVHRSRSMQYARDTIAKAVGKEALQAFLGNEGNGSNAKNWSAEEVKRALGGKR
jgi:hypothetical protein